MTTHRERMLAALRGRPTDCIPFAPRLERIAKLAKAFGPVRPDCEAGKNL